MTTDWGMQAPLRKVAVLPRRSEAMETLIGPGSLTIDRIRLMEDNPGLVELRQAAAKRDGKRTAHREVSIAYMVELHRDQYQRGPCDCVPHLYHHMPPVDAAPATPQ